MRIGDFDDLDLGDLISVKATVFFSRDGIVRGNEKQSVGLVEIDAELALAVAGHFMASGGRESGNLSKMVGGTEFQQALLKLSGPCSPELLLDLLGGRADFLELLAAEENEHRKTILSKSLTFHVHFYEFLAVARRPSSERRTPALLASQAVRASGKAVVADSAEAAV